MKCRENKGAGFTFLEVMAALAITAGLLMTLLYSVNHHLKALEFHEFSTVGGTLARGKLDELRSSPSKTLATKEGSFESPNEEYSYRIDVKDSLYNGVSEVSVTVARGVSLGNITSTGESLTLKKIMRTNTLRQ